MGDCVRALVLVVVLLLSGCAANVSNSLSPAEMGQIRIEAVKVTVKPDAQIYWGSAELEYAERHQAQAPKRVVRKDAGDNRVPFNFPTPAATTVDYQAVASSP